MPREFFDATPEEQNVVLVDEAILHNAEKLVLGCEACSEDAELPFDNALDRLTGNDPSVSNYILSEPAKCPRCRRDVTEKTLIELGE